MKHGLLLINLGTPKDTSTKSIRRFLAEFLADKRVVTLPAVLRYLLLYAIILPFRTKRTAHAYRSIWTKKGSPLLVNSLALMDKLASRNTIYDNVALGMRYGTPSLESALLSLKDCDTLTILPLYPQYSSAATGSSLEKALKIIARENVIPSVKTIRDFHDHPSFIQAQSEAIKPYIKDFEHILFSYHGVPESHLHDSGCKKICEGSCPATALAPIGCYRAQCFQSTDLIAKNLKLKPHEYTNAFQSRLGKTPWIKPYSDEILVELHARGIRRLAVVCPSFVADCLETLEEIGLRMKEDWLAMGGESFVLIPCLNDSETWVEALIAISQDCVQFAPKSHD